MSILTRRNSGSSESVVEFDIRRTAAQGLRPSAESVIENELPDSNWRDMLPPLIDTSYLTSPYFIAYQAVRAYLSDRRFRSNSINVRDLLLNPGDRHHVFPRKNLKDQGLTRGRYNQIANDAIAQSEINIAVWDTLPEICFAELAEQVTGGRRRYGGVVDQAELEENLAQF